MVTIKQFAVRLDSINEQLILSTAANSIDETKEQLIEKNREQLLEGKDRSGDDISPTYQDDPFFKTKEAAQRYSDWKDEITPNPKRKPGVPNLFITGAWVHNPLKVLIDGENIKYDIPSPIGMAIFQKYTDKVVGLNKEKKAEYIFETLNPLFVSKLRQILKL